MFRTGRYTLRAIEEREQAKLLKLEADQLARDGLKFIAKEKILEALKLETAWIDRYERLGPKPGRKPKKRKVRFMPGGYPGTMGFGQHTAAAKTLRAMTMRIRRERPADYARTGGLGRFTRAARIAAGKATEVDRIVRERREAAFRAVEARMAKKEARTERKLRKASLIEAADIAAGGAPTQVAPKPASEKPE